MRKTMETLITIAHCGRTPNLPTEYETEMTTKMYDVVIVMVIKIIIRQPVSSPY
jgi:hypothetical protein